MLSRKRPATDLAAHSGTEKRIRSDSLQPFLDVGTYHTAAVIISPTPQENVPGPRRSPRQHEASNIAIQCPHKQATKCGLSLPTCCACTDKRPMTGRYPEHVDGHGIQYTSDRSKDYCPGCRNYTIGSAHEDNQQAYILIRVFYEYRVLDFHLTEWLKPEEMPNYIARQIQCAPQQLVLVACDRDQHIKRHMTQARKDYYLQGARRFDFVVDRAGVLGDEDMEMMDVDA